MASQPDPYRTLGLAPGASADEIRRAYRRLAKANHPDSAGEKALPRFLAIQAAYEALEGSNGARPPGTRPASAGQSARASWRADPDRARTAREGPSTRQGATARPGPAAGQDGAASGRRRRQAAGDEPGRPPGGRKRSSNKATPGSTTYDTAEDEPFEPEWSGGTWYGASSGTYWTLNPKEYADPRKHGPEYQRRARRRMGGEAAPPPDESGAEGRDEPPDGPDAGATGPTPPTGPPIDAWDRWSDDDPGVATAPASGPDGGIGVAATGGLLGLIGLRGRIPARVGLALLGWPAIGIAISTIAGEVTGCGRFAAGCIELFAVGTWVAQLAVIAILLAVPALAAVSAIGTLAALAASVPTAVVLSASGGAREPGASAAILGGVLALAYLAGVVFAVVRRSRFGRIP